MASDMDDLLKQARDIIGNTGRELLGLIEGRVEAATREALETISAFLGTELPDSVEAAATIDRIERYADAWAGLVPQAPEMRAAIGRALGARHRVDPLTLPRIAAALTLADAAVAAEYAGVVTPDANADPPLMLPDEGLPADVSAIEAAIEFVQVDKDHDVALEGEVVDGLYLVVFGRLARVIRAEDGSEEIAGVLGPGDVFGEAGVINDMTATEGVYALRESGLARISQPAFERLSRTQPGLLLALLHRLAGRGQGSLDWGGRSGEPVRTVAIVPLAPEGLLREFTRLLAEAFSAYRRCAVVGQEQALAALDADSAGSFSDTYDDRVASWFKRQEAEPGFVIYLAEPSLSEWTLRCVRQADRTFVVAAGLGDPPAGLADIVQTATGREGQSARAELVQLYPDRAMRPRHTRKWLALGRFRGHYHVALDSSGDTSRLVRHLTGRGVGLVISGGGARSLAALGTIQALNDAGVPIDYVGGTSGGAMIAGHWALGRDVEAIADLYRRHIPTGTRELDRTFPLVSLYGAANYIPVLDAFYGDAQIEDLWLPYFAVSTNLSKATTMVHRNGPLWFAVRASSAIPTAFPPILQDGDLLVDGMLLDKLPVDVMSQTCEGGPVIALDVNVKEMRKVEYSFGSSISARQIIFNRVNPFRKQRLVAPSSLDIVLRTTEIASTHRRRAQAAKADLCLSPPVGHVGVFGFAAIDELMAIGRESNREEITQWWAAEQAHPRD